MNVSYFISKRISLEDKQSFSSTIHKIAVASIGLGLAIMIVSFLILTGFQTTVKDKIYNFSAHFQVTRYTLGNSFEEVPISLQNEIYQHPEKFEYVDHVQEYTHKAGLIKTEDEVLGIIFKGVGSRFDTVRFNEYLVEGRFVKFPQDTYAKEVVISSRIADKLKLGVGDDIIIHFFMNPPRARKLDVVGIYDTNLSEYYDDKFIMGDMGLIQRLNNWPDSLAGGMEIFVDDVKNMDKAELLLDDELSLDLFVEPVKEKYIQVFEWLGLISRQVNIFLVIILIVVCVNMVSIVLILIMERIHMVGLLKAFGATNRLIRTIFTFTGMQLIVKGLLFGNALGLGLCALQYFFKIIPLNPKDYYMSYVPIGWDFGLVIALNILTVVVVSLIIFIPTAVISRINPIKSIRFD